MDTETLFTVQEAAKKIGVSPSAIRNATLEGRLSFVVKFGRKLIQIEALAAYQQRTQVDGTAMRGRPRGARNKKVDQASEIDMPETKNGT